MSSPRKFTSPYLTGLSGLASTSPSAAAIKPKKKSKNSVTKLSESAAAVKKIQDEIWQTAKESLRQENEGDHQASPRQEVSFDDASSCGGIVVEQFLDEMKDAGDILSESPSPDETQVQGDDIADENKGQSGASALPVRKNSLVLEHGSHIENSNSSTVEETNELLNQNGDGDTITTPQENTSSPEALLKSILKKPSVYATKPKKEANSGGGNSRRSSKGPPKGKYGRPTKENKDKDAPSVVGRVVVTKLKGAQGSTSNLEVHNKFSNNKTVVKSPRKKSTVASRKLEEDKEKDKDQQQIPLSSQASRKSVRFSTRVNVHTVPYEPRAGSRACDWQRNMLEQRVQTFRQLMKEVGSAEDVDLFSNSMLFPTPDYTAYHLPNPNFGLRGHPNAGRLPGSGIVGMPGIGRTRNSLCNNSHNKFNY